MCVCVQAHTKNALKSIQLTFRSDFCKAALVSARSAEKLWLLSKLEFSWAAPLKFFLIKPSYHKYLIVKLSYILKLFIIKQCVK